MEDVVLQVERALGQLDQDPARDERVDAGREESKRGSLLAPHCVRRRARRDPALKSCHLGGTFSW